MNTFGKHEYILQRDNLILTERTHYQKLWGYFMLCAGGLATYIVTFEPHSIASKATDPQTKQIMVGVKWAQAITFTAMGIHGAFFYPTNRFAITLTDADLKVGSLTPIPIDLLRIELHRDPVARFIHFMRGSETVFTFTTNRRAEVEPFLQQLRLLGLGLKIETGQGMSKRIQLFP